MNVQRGLRLLVALALLWFAAGPASPQQITGRVIVQGTDAGEPGVRVTLLDTLLTPLATATSDAVGAFRFRAVRAGTYVLQGVTLSAQTPLSTPVTLARGDSTDVLLTLPSPFVVLALSCPGALSDHNSTTLVGTILDRATAVAIPGAEVTLTWANGHSNTRSDNRGAYRFCAVPTATPLHMSVRFLGRSTVHELRLQAGSVSRADFMIEATRGQQGISEIRSEPRAGTLRSRVRLSLEEAGSSIPLAGAAVRLEPGVGTVVADRRGLVTLDSVAAGSYALIVERIGYGRWVGSLEVAAGLDIAFAVRVPPQPIALDPLEATVTSPRLTRDQLRTSTRLAVIAGEELAQAEGRAASVADVIRALPGVSVHEGNFSTLDHGNLMRIVCVESNRRLDRLRLPDGVQEPFCDMVTVIVDGVETYQGGAFIRNLSVRDFESIEYLGPLDAGILYGVRAAQSGALVLWSRGQGPHRTGRRIPRVP